MNRHEILLCEHGNEKTKFGRVSLYLKIFTILQIMSNFLLGKLQYGQTLSQLNIMTFYTTTKEVS